MERLLRSWIRARSGRQLGLVLAIVSAGMVLAPEDVLTQALDICGCATIPNLPAFDSRSPETYPTGATSDGSTLTIPLPPDGILRFSSVYMAQYVRFVAAQTNAPAMILVKGDATFTSPGGCCLNLSVSGLSATGGDSNLAGVGALGGPGGFRGADGANQALNGASIGGTGFGPGGGSGGQSGACGGAGGQFFGSSDLLPLVGGAGGGGGCSTGPQSFCSGGGGGGGGGALLIAVNGTLSIGGFYFFADGANGSSTSNGSCAAGGGGGSGGAVRLLAGHFAQAGSVQFLARGGSPGYLGGYGSPGRIRFESVDASAQSTFLATDPAAIRVVGPTPLANPVAPAVSIVGVGGNAVPAVPLGVFGAIDITVAGAGSTSIDVSTNGVPGGTTVQVTVKPRVGAIPLLATIPLATCNAAGACQASAAFTLTPGAYVVEARATFQTPQ